ncbi:acyl-CoA dehydrogenase [Solibacillus sp. CAU 1738]|uniref:acyl-CoA dehydrogenase n=1 Tax=Solibacillus sp. CAU 1738 TaxID=3140363 RepID=UPI003261569A
MSEMKEMIFEVVEKMFKNHVEKETVDLLEDGKWVSDVWGILQDNEMLNVAVAEQYGGAGGDLDDLFSLYKLVGKYAVPVPFVEHTLANVILEKVGLTPSTNKITVLIDEMQTLTLQADSVSGELYNVPWARHVQELVTLAKNGQGLHIVKLSFARTSSITPQSNLAAEPRDKVVFEQVQVLEQAVIDVQQLTQILKLLTAATVATMAGAIDKAYELTIRYSKEREQFGRPIHRFQLVQQHIAVLAGEAVLTDASVDNMITALAEGREQNEVAFARLRIDESSKIVATSAHQVHAAIGVTHEHSLHQYTRRLWAWRDEGYTSLYWKKQMAQTLLQSDMDLWTLMTQPKQMYETQIGGI